MTNSDLIGIGLLAFIAGLILFRLYATLGRRTGSERPEPRPVGAPQGLPRIGQNPQAAALGPAAATPSGEGLLAIVRADPRFDVDAFLKGARGAYEMILNAFAKGDRAALQPLLTQKVYDTFTGAITQREQSGGQPPELVRLRRAEIADAGVEGDTARISVKFEAELAEGAVGVRDAKERWTFERSVRSADPNWKLARVSAA